VRVVFDTNVLVSAIVFPGSVADRALGHVLPDGTDTLLLSDALLDELLTVMARKFARDAEALSRLAIFLVGNSERVEPRVKVSVLADARTIESWNARFQVRLTRSLLATRRCWCRAGSKVFQY
jgi:predicted nucleic acid-binding protein